MAINFNPNAPKIIGNELIIARAAPTLLTSPIRGQLQRFRSTAAETIARVHLPTHEIADQGRFMAEVYNVGSEIPIGSFATVFVPTGNPGSSNCTDQGGGTTNLHLDVNETSGDCTDLVRMQSPANGVAFFDLTFSVAGALATKRILGAQIRIYGYPVTPSPRPTLVWAHVLDGGLAAGDFGHVPINFNTFSDPVTLNNSGIMQSLDTLLLTPAVMDDFDGTPHVLRLEIGAEEALHVVICAVNLVVTHCTENRLAAGLTNLAVISKAWQPFALRAPSQTADWSKPANTDLSLVVRPVLPLDAVVSPRFTWPRVESPEPLLPMGTAADGTAAVTFDAFGRITLIETLDTTRVHAFTPGTAAPAAGADGFPYASFGQEFAFAGFTATQEFTPAVNVTVGAVRAVVSDFFGPDFPLVVVIRRRSDNAVMGAGSMTVEEFADPTIARPLFAPAKLASIPLYDPASLVAGVEYEIEFDSEVEVTKSWLVGSGRSSQLSTLVGQDALTFGGATNVMRAGAVGSPTSFPQNDLLALVMQVPPAVVGVTTEVLAQAGCSALACDDTPQTIPFVRVCWDPVDTENVLDLPSSGAFASSSDAAPFDITGDIDITVYGLQIDAIPAGNVQGIVTKYTDAGDQRSYGLFLLNGTALLSFFISSNGTAGGVSFGNSTVLLPYTPSQRFDLQVTRRVSDGRVQFFHRPEGSMTWQQLGADVIVAAGVNMFNSTSPLRVGDPTYPMLGSVRRVELRNGLAGAVVADPDFAAQTPGTTSFVDAAGNPWNISGSGAIVAGPFADFEQYEVQRYDPQTEQWQPVAVVADPDVSCVDDHEARVGLLQRWRVRGVTVFGAASPWSDEVEATPGAAGSGMEGPLLTFTSNHRPDLNCGGDDVEQRRRYTFLDAEEVEYLQLYGRDYQVKLQPVEHRGLTFERTFLARAKPAGVGVERFDPIRAIAEADIPYVTVRERGGGRWFAGVEATEGEINVTPTRAGCDTDAVHLATVRVTEVLATPVYSEAATT